MFSSILALEAALDRGDVSLQSLINYQKENHLPFRWHPLGFIICKLITEGRFNARFHYWPSHEGRPQDTGCQIHDHTFRFSSWVLAGEVQNIEYKVDKSDKSGIAYALYKAEYVDEISILRKTKSTICLSISSCLNQTAGSKYQMEAGCLHETKLISSEPAVTVLITEDILNQAPTVVGPLTGQAEYEYVRSYVSESDIEAIFGTSCYQN